MGFSIGNLVGAVVGAVAKVATAVVNALSPVAKGGGLLGGIVSAIVGAAAVVANVCEDGEIDEDEEELLEEALKLLVGAFIVAFGSDASSSNSDGEKTGIFNSISAAASKSWNSIKEIAGDFYNLPGGFCNSAKERADKRYNSKYDFCNWLFAGIPDIGESILESNKERGEKAFKSGSLQDYGNWLTMGGVDVVNGAFNPKDPFSKEHWENSFEVVATLFGAKKIRSGMAAGIIDGEEKVIVNNSMELYSENGMSEFVEGAGNLKFKEGYDKHIIDVEDIVRKKNKGVVGGHNFDNFKQAFKDKGWNVDECIIGIKEHPTVDGIYEVEYRLPALNNKGEIIAEQYKNIPNPKTVFDPSKISNEDILELGKQAMEDGMKNSRIINGREVEGYAKNGLKFKGYINGETGEITNFFPTLN